ncbi:MAG: tyrosine-type recombinase/integrase [Bacilli bacterium]|nr:tyrosine-type recombinase/integrase [Bacilli bacterium]
MNQINWKDEINRYIQTLDRKPITRDSYNRILNSFYEYLISTSKLTPSKEDIIVYKEYLKEHVGSATVQKVMVVLRGFFIDLASNGIYPNIMLGIRGEKINRNFKRSALTIEEVSKLLKKAKKLATTLEGKRNYAIVSLIATAGLRTIEVERANKNDFSFKGDVHILFIQGKGRDDKSDYAKISNEVYSIIEDYIFARNDNEEALFVTHSRNTKPSRLTTKNIRGIVKELLRRIGIDDPHYSAHSLRHSLATNLIKNGMSINEAQLLLRHKDISTTMFYVHSIDRESNNGELIMSDILFGGKNNGKQ